MSKKDDDDKLEAELKAALKARKDAEPIVKAGKKIQVSSRKQKNGRKE